MRRVEQLRLYSPHLDELVLSGSVCTRLFHRLELTRHDGRVDQMQAEALVQAEGFDAIEVGSVLATYWTDVSGIATALSRELWRVASVSEPLVIQGQGETVSVELRPHWMDTMNRVVLPQADDRSTGATVYATDVAPMDAIEHMLGLIDETTSEGLPRYVAGVASAELVDLRVDVTVEGATVLAVLDAIADSAEAMWRVTPNGISSLDTPVAAVQYRVDLVFVNPYARRLRLLTEMPKLRLSGAPTSLVHAVPPMAGRRSSSEQDLTTTIVPLSRRAEGGAATATIEEAIFRTGEREYRPTANRTRIALYRHRPSPGDADVAAAVSCDRDALAGLRIVEVEDGPSASRTFEVVASWFPNVIEVAGDATDVAETIQFVDAEGYGVRRVTSPTVEKRYGLVEEAVRYDVNPRPNLIERAGISADMSAWHDGVLVGVRAENNASAERTTAPEDVRHGRASARFVLNGGGTTALVGDDLNVSAIVNFPAFPEGADQTKTETATWDGGGSDQGGARFRVTGAAFCTLLDKGGLTSALARLTLRCIDGSDNVLATFVDSLGGAGARQLVIDVVAPAGTESIEVQSHVRCVAGQNSYASAEITGVAFEVVGAVTTQPAIVLLSGGLPKALAAYVSLRVTEGSVYVQVEDAAGAVVVGSNAASGGGEPLRVLVESDPELGSDTPFSTVQLQGEGLSGPQALVIRLASPVATVVVDAATLVEGLEPQVYEPAMGPEALWEQAVMDLARRLCEPIDVIETEYFDLAADEAGPTPAQSARVEPGDLVEIETARGLIRSFVTDVRTVYAAQEPEPRVSLRIQPGQRTHRTGTPGGEVSVILSGFGTGLTPADLLPQPVALLSGGLLVVADGYVLSGTPTAAGASTLLLSTDGDVPVSNGVALTP